MYYGLTFYSYRLVCVLVANLSECYAFLQKHSDKTNLAIFLDVVCESQLQSISILLRAAVPQTSNMHIIICDIPIYTRC